MGGRLATEGGSAPRRGTRRQRRVGSNPGGSAPTHRSVSSTGRGAGTPPPWLPRTTRIPSRAPYPTCRRPRSTTSPRWLHTCTYLPRSRTAAATRAAPTGAPTAAPRRCTRCHRARAPRRSGILPGSCSSRTGTCWRSTGYTGRCWRSRPDPCTNSARRTPAAGPPCTALPRAAAAGRAPAARRARSAGGRRAPTAATALILL